MEEVEKLLTRENAVFPLPFDLWAARFPSRKPIAISEGRRYIRKATLERQGQNDEATEEQSETEAGHTKGNLARI